MMHIPNFYFAKNNPILSIPNFKTQFTLEFHRKVILSATSSAVWLLATRKKNQTQVFRFPFSTSQIGQSVT